MTLKPNSTSSIFAPSPMLWIIRCRAGSSVEVSVTTRPMCGRPPGIDHVTTSPGW